MADININEQEEKKSLNFIEQKVKTDLAEGKNGGRLQTRFPRISVMPRPLQWTLALPKSLVASVT